MLAGVGALLVGNRTFGGDDPNRGTDHEGAGGRYQGPVSVLTHRRPGLRPTRGARVRLEQLPGESAHWYRVLR